MKLCIFDHLTNLIMFTIYENDVAANNNACPVLNATSLCVSDNVSGLAYAIKDSCEFHSESANCKFHSK